MAFNQLSLRGSIRRRYEAKLGVNLERPQGCSGWSNYRYQWGSQSYHAVTYRLGLEEELVGRAALSSRPRRP